MDSIRVPLIARNQYSITGQPNFLRLLKRALDEQTQDTNGTKSDGQEKPGSSPGYSLAPVIQVWLFFGIASEALGRSIRHEEFSEADSDGPYLSIDLRIPEWYWQELKAR